MCTTRRHFLGSTALGSMGLAMPPLLRFERASAAGSPTADIPDAAGGRMAAAEGSFYRAYRSRPASTSDVTAWVQIDLGSSQPIEVVKVYPSRTHLLAGEGFPLRFRIECSDDPAFQTRSLIADKSKADYPDPGDRILQFRARKAQGRYVRLTATRLRPNKLPAILLSMPKSIIEPIQTSIEAAHVFALAKVEVLSGGTDLAVRRPVTVDSEYGNPEDAQQLTRPPRALGEGLITDHPRNVTAAGQWRPPVDRAHMPAADVQLQDGLFLAAIEGNIRYLLESYSVDDLLRQFRQRAGKPVPAPTQNAGVFAGFWEENLAGSNAGRFLMGAATTLRWMEHAELRSRLDAVVDGIAECRQRNGYIMAYPEDTFFVSERGAYTRAWLTHGLIEAGCAGNKKAFELLRGYYDWYNTRPYLAQALRGCIQGGQGMVANTRLYFTPVGKPADIHVIQRFFQENYWMEDLAAREVDAVWQYPYDRPHVYLLTNLEAYLDLYRATGEQHYLQAVLGGWDLFRANWQNTGGSFSIKELDRNVPGSNSLYERLGETCGSAFWVLLNHRLHLLEPDEEKYVNEIEKSIYNVLLANHAGVDGIRYHTMLVGQKEKPRRENTCCEGQGTRLIGNLPQYIYSTAADGVYVNLFEASDVTWRQSGEIFKLQMQTSFPRSPQVQLTVHPAKPMPAKIRIRTPSWAAGALDIDVNGTRFAQGTPGSYVTLDRTWSPGDVISFVLPMAFKMTRYSGVDQIAGRERFALEYGPLLLAALGAAETEILLRLAANPLELGGRLQPIKDEPLHFTMPFDPSAETKFVPYFEVAAESFSCFPIVQASVGLF